MKKFLSLVLVCAAMCFAGSDNFKNIERLGTDANTSLQLGYNDTQFLNASSGNAAVSSFPNSRACGVDSTGVVKIGYLDSFGALHTEVRIMVQGIIYPIRNIQTLYQYYTGTTAGTAKSFGADGVVVTNAIHIYR